MGHVAALLSRRRGAGKGASGWGEGVALPVPVAFAVMLLMMDASSICFCFFLISILMPRSLDGRVVDKDWPPTPAHTHTHTLNHTHCSPFFSILLVVLLTRSPVAKVVPRSVPFCSAAKRKRKKNRTVASHIISSTIS